MDIFKNIICNVKEVCGKKIKIHTKITEWLSNEIRAESKQKERSMGTIYMNITDMKDYSKISKATIWMVRKAK